MDVNLHPDICRQKNFLLLASSGNRFAAAVPRLLHIKGRVKCIKVLGIQVIGDYAERFAKPLIMNHFPLSQEANGIRHLRILYQAQNIVVGDSCFLFCCQILMKICDRISFGLKFTSIKWNPSCGLGPKAGGVINVVGPKSRFFNLFHSKVSGKLMDNSADNLEMT